MRGISITIRNIPARRQMIPQINPNFRNLFEAIIYF